MINWIQKGIFFISLHKLIYYQLYKIQFQIKVFGRSTVFYLIVLLSLIVPPLFQLSRRISLLLEFIKDIIRYCQKKSHKEHNLHVHGRNASGYGNNCLRALGAHIRNSLPENIKCTDSVYKLMNFLKGWYGCKCYLCIV